MKRFLKIFMMLMIFVIGTSFTVSLADTDYSLTVIQNNISITTNKSPGTVVTLTPKSSDITGWSVEQGGVTLNGNSFTMPSSDVTIRAIYDIRNYTITATAGSGGTITPNGTITVQAGSSKTFTITPSTGYKINSIIVNGSPVNVTNPSGMTYTFNNVMSNQTITATFVAIPKYTVTWTNWDGSVLKTDANLAEGTEPAYNGATPTRPADAQYTYTFSGWSPTVGAITGDTTYTAQFSRTGQTYTVTWKNDDGTQLEKDTNVAYGTTPTYDGAIPTKAASAQNTYEFSGWSPAIVNVTGNATYTAQFISKCEVTFNANGGSGSMTNQVFTSGVAQGLRANIFTYSGRTFSGWSTAANGSGTRYTDGQNITITSHMTLYAQWNAEAGSDTSGANAPIILTSSLYPVNYTGLSWGRIGETEWDYNYNEGKWANAMTADGSIYVWIPRFSYKIISGYNQGGEDVEGEIDIKFSNGTVDYTSDGYLSHPAFTLNGRELTGFWVMKYKASMSNDTLVSETNKSPYTTTNYDDAFNLGYNLNRALDSHMMKNTEWGAIAYLTKAIGNVPYRNNDGKTGWGSNSMDSDYNLEGIWNTTEGMYASTTGNVYGVYDMNMATPELVASRYVTTSPSTSSTEFPYTNYYPATAGLSHIAPTRGDATSETSNAVGANGLTWNAWYGAPSDTINRSESSVAFQGHYTRTEGIFGYRPLPTTGGAAMRVVLTPIYSMNYTVTFNPNGGSGTMANQTFTSGVAQNLNANTFTRNGYTFTGWATSAGGNVVYANQASYTATANVTLYAKWIANGTVNADASGANAPVLVEGLTPVNWNGTAWVDTTEANWKYNYNSVATSTHSTVEGTGDGAWANARTADGSMYVWIPRFTYAVDAYPYSTVKSWNSLDDPGTAKIRIKFSNGTVDDYGTDSNDGFEYKIHSAFNPDWAIDPTAGYTGIWVAKYEASAGTEVNNSNWNSELSVPTASKNVAKFIPNASTFWRSTVEGLNDIYKIAYNTYRNADSHLMTNHEWGAVAYLTNAIGRIPYINNTTTTGKAGNSQNAADGATSYAWDTAGGVKASTTHNVYGIYDMSGGQAEFTSAYFSSGTVSGIDNLTSWVSSDDGYKYVDFYTSDYLSTWYTQSALGDAIGETSITTNPWDSDVAVFPSGTEFAFVRGGGYQAGSSAGIYAYNAVDGEGYGADELLYHHSFRVVLRKDTVTNYTITFNPNGGSVSPTTKTVTSGLAYGTLPTPTKSGYIFGGWYTNTSYTTKIKETTTVTTSANNQTLYARWFDNDYVFTLTYDANGGMFADGSTVNEIRADLGTVTKYSKTSNIIHTTIRDDYDYGTYDEYGSVNDTITIEGVDSLTLEVTYETEEGCDNVIIKDGNNYKVAELSGELDTWENIIEGDTVHILFEVDYDTAEGIGYLAKVTGVKKEVTSGEYKEPTKSGDILLGWSTDQNATQAEYGVGQENLPIETEVLYAVWQSSIPTELQSKPNAPVLGSGMSAVYWTDLDGETERTSSTFSSSMYNYTMGDGRTDSKISKWANAKTPDGSYWVWIPRYAYKITYTDESRTIATAEKTQYGNIDILFMDGTSSTHYKNINGVSTPLPEGYVVHPAFQAMTSTDQANLNSLGKWNEELKGIWVAKYEASGDFGDKLASSEGKKIASKPSETSWGNISHDNAYQNSLDMYPSLNSHLMKNSEWGAVAYLAHSAYGRNGNEVTANKYTEYKTGVGGTSNEWNTAIGRLASTTGNIYGVYDMAGGAAEATASYVDYGSSYTYDGEELYAVTDLKTKQVYPGSGTPSSSYLAAESIYGDAIFETSTSYSGSTWNQDSSRFPNDNNPFFTRGGDAYGASEVGIFNYSRNTGEYSGFRPVLCINGTEAATVTVTFVNDVEAEGEILSTKTLQLGSNYGTLPTVATSLYDYLGDLYTFDDWYYFDPNTYNSIPITSSTTLVKDTDHTITAHYEYIPSGSGSDDDGGGTTEHTHEYSVTMAKKYRSCPKWRNICTCTSGQDCWEINYKCDICGDPAQAGGCEGCDKWFDETTRMSSDGPMADY